MTLEGAVKAAGEAEDKLARRLLILGERHKADHDVFHLTRTLGRLAASHADELLGRDGDTPDHGGPLHALREKASELTGSREPAGALLLRDLTELYLTAEEASIRLVIAAQGAQATRDAELLGRITRIHTETLRTVKWLTTRIKQTAPSVLA